MSAVFPSALRPQAKGVSLSAPVGGWNARDSIAVMPASDALVMDNWFPEDSSVRVRPGSVRHATVEEASPRIRSLLSFKSADGTAQLFAATDEGIYDVTEGGEIDTAETSCTNGVWQYTNFSNASGSRLFCCNGVDNAKVWDGTSWLDLSETSSPALTGLDTTKISNVTAFKGRLYFCEKDSLDFWYLPVNSFAGEAKRYPMSATFQRGGYLVAIDSWTVDGGNGIDDYLVMITSEGEVAVFQGYDPENAQYWSRVGVYFIGAPLSRRCFVKLGGDLGLLTARGLFPLSKALQTADVDKQIAFSDKIRNAWSVYITQGRGHFGWEAQTFPEGPLLLVNVPVQSSPEINFQYSYQFVMNLTSGAWCRFLGMPAEVWCLHEGELYFARFGVVSKAWTGTDDAGQPVDARVKSAFMYPAGRGNLAQITLLRPIFETSATNLPIQFTIDTDYTERELPKAGSVAEQFAGVWDAGNWDEVLWAGASALAKWRTIFHTPGKALALRLRVLNKGATIVWNATDFILKRGGLM